MVSLRNCLPAACCLLLAAPAHAASDQDYSPENPGWNGLSRFVEILQSEGYLFTFEQRLDWDAAEPNDVLLFFYPTREEGPAPDPARVADFLHEGGRVMIADDFGAAAESFAALGITRSTELPGGLEAYGDNAALPFAEPVPGHSLGAGVDLLLTNHPTAFRSDLTPAFVFGRPPERAEPDEGLYSVVIEGGLDEGRIIAVADPSIFINAMLAYRGNEVFVHNLLYHLAGPPPGRGTFRIFSGRFAEWGQGNDGPENPLSQIAELQDFLSEFNEWLGELSLYAPKGELARLMAALLVLAGFMALLARLAQAASRYDGHWLSGAERPPGPIGPAHEPREGLTRSAALQVEAEDFLRSLDGPAGLAARLGGDRRRAERRVRALLGKIHALPPGRAPKERLAALYREWLSLLEEAKLLDLWKRRGRG